MIFIMQLLCCEHYFGMGVGFSSSFVNTFTDQPYRLQLGATILDPRDTLGGDWFWVLVKLVKHRCRLSR